MGEVDPDSNEHNPTNHVFSISLFKQEPECLTYVSKLEAKYGLEDSEMMEQLHVVRAIVNDLIEKCTSANLNAYSNMCREARVAIRNERLVKEAQDKQKDNVLPFPPQPS